MVDAMSLNIKNREAHRLAEELAKLTGESMTVAVTIVIRERLASSIRRPPVAANERTTG